MTETDEYIPSFYTSPLTEKQMSFGSADECEHCILLSEPCTNEITAVGRRFVSTIFHDCALECLIDDCPVPNRACRMKLEWDSYVTDMLSMDVMEKGTDSIAMKAGYFDSDL